MLKKKGDFMKVILLWLASLFLINCHVQHIDKMFTCEEVKKRSKEFMETCAKNKKCLELYEESCRAKNSEN